MKICQHLKQSHGLKSRLEVNEHSLDVHGMTEMTAGSNQYHLTFLSSDSKSSNLTTEQEEKSVPGTLRFVDSECMMYMLHTLQSTGSTERCSLCEDSTQYLQIAKYRRRRPLK